MPATVSPPGNALIAVRAGDIHAVVARYSYRPVVFFSLNPTAPFCSIEQPRLSSSTIQAAYCIEIAGTTRTVAVIQ